MDIGGIQHVQGRNIDRAGQYVPLQASRRRRVLAVLVGTTLGFFVLGMIPALRVLWGLSLLAFAATAGYLALLIYVHRRAVERRVKVIDIRDLRREPGVTERADAHVVVVSRRRIGEDYDWSEDELVDADLSYDYDEIMAGGR